jgi:2,4-dienoyl-CoA reductase-like NADH-dependent reductase (Old Yellow Enzyme family)/thioredoxin reductase
MNTSYFQKLLEPVRIGSLELKNRMIVPALTTNFANSDATVNERLKDFLIARAKGGFSLITTEITSISPYGNRMPFQLGIWDDKFIPGFRDLAKAIHDEGAKIAIQLFHAGRQTHSSIIGRAPVAPSTIPCPVLKDIPKELTLKEIEELEEQFAEGARRAKEAGVDAVELQGAHGYLVAQFMSYYANRRTDAYGGSLEGLLRFPIEIIQKIRSKVGPDYPIIFRLSGEEKTLGGRTIQETKMLIPFLEEAGVDAFDVSIGVYNSFHYLVAPMAVPPGFNVNAASEVRKVSSVPVIAVGRINDPHQAEQILREGQADLIAMGRASIADPELPNKVASGNYDDIRWCIGCNECIDRLSSPELYLSCSVNPTVGREREMTLTPAPRSKKVLVIGGGPGGMEAARVAALRGHEVYLYEKGEKLGGQFNLAATPPCKQDITKAINYLSIQIKKVGVKIILGKEVTEELIDELQPEAVVIATGGVPLIPDIPGTQQERVATAFDILDGKLRPGRRILVIGGGMVGCETADFLGQLRGREVTLVEAFPEIARDVGDATRHFLLQRLAQENVRIITSALVKRITEDGVILERNDSEERLSSFDTIILALGVVPLNNLASRIQAKVKEMYVIGDAKQTRKAIDAIAEGTEVGRMI